MTEWRHDDAARWWNLSLAEQFGNVGSEIISHVKSSNHEPHSRHPPRRLRSHRADRRRPLDSREHCRMLTPGIRVGAHEIVSSLGEAEWPTCIARQTPS